MSPEQRERLKAILRTFDEAGLVALSNRGLVRRAHKDLDAAGSLAVTESSQGLIVAGPGWVVRMPPAGPAAATDDTPATGVTRHILAATLWLRDHWAGTAAHAAEPPSEATSDPAPATKSVGHTPDQETIVPIVEAMDQLTWNQLSRWAGASILREAASLLAQPAQVLIERTTILRVQFPEHEVEVRFLPLDEATPARSRSVALLDACLCTAPQSFYHQWVALAVLAARREWGRPLHRPDQLATAPQSGLPRSREELLLGIERLLESMVSVGLSHPSDMMLQRLFTLSVSCVGAHLPRLAGLLRGLASEIQLQLDRHARSDSARLLERVAFAAALATAIRRSGDSPPVALVGQHRSRYEHLGTLRGVGCGVYPWRAASGLEGLQAVIWDRDRARFWTWSVSRPPTTGNRTLQSLYTSEPVWSGGISPSSFSRALFLAEHVQANHHGRLSTSRQTRLISSCTIAATEEAADNWVDGVTDFGDRGFADWRLLRDHASQAVSVGLHEVDPTMKIVALFPKVWGPRTFLELEQRLSWTLLDEHGLSVELSVPWTTLTKETIECMEALQPDRDCLHAVIGLVDQRAGQLQLFPVAFLCARATGTDRLINPAFDQGRIHPPEAEQQRGLHRHKRSAPIATAFVPDGPEDDSIIAGNLPEAIAQRLSEVERYLLSLAESGGHQLAEGPAMQAGTLASRVIEAGLLELGTALEDLGGVLRDHPESAPSVLLRTAYVCRLYRDVAR